MLAKANEVKLQKCKDYAGYLSQAVDLIASSPNLRELYKSYYRVKEFKYPKEYKNDISEATPGLKTLKESFKKQVVDKVGKLFIEGFTYDELVEMRNRASEQVKVVVKAVEIFEDEYDALKSAQNKVDFSDMLRYAWKLLKTDEIKEEIRSRHDYVFVDEAQDLNYIQNDIVKAIAPENGLFVVGDVKQSIYRFMLAEPNIFLERLNEWNARGEAVFFRENFRSDPEILNFVNKVFATLMIPSFGGIDYNDGNDFVINEREREVEVSPVTILTSSATKIKDSKPNYSGVYDLLSDEGENDDSPKDDASWIYNYIQNCIGKKIYVKGKEKTVEYSDIAILFRARNASDGIIPALASKGIPFNFGKFEQNNGREELKVFMDYLSVIDNVFDDYALISSLHSYIGGMTNEELADVKLKFPRSKTYAEACLAYAESDGKYAPKMKEFFDGIDRFRFLSTYTEMSEFLKLAIEESGFATYVASADNGLQNIAAINEYVYSIKGKTWAEDLHSFIVHYRECEEPKLKGKTADSNGVNVCTCHETKGLEYPIVILAGVDHKGNNTGPQVKTDKRMGVAMKYLDASKNVTYDVFDYNVISLKKTLDENEDMVRLLYVALTRAQSALAICLPDMDVLPKLLPDMCSTFGDALRYAISKDKSLLKYVEEIDPVDFEKASKVLKVCPEPLPVDEKVKEVLSFKYPEIKATELRNKYSVSQINVGDDLTLPLFAETEEKAKKGTAYHLVMQYIDLECSTAEEVRKDIERLTSCGILSYSDVKEVKPEEIALCLNSRVGKAARAGETYREKRFVLRKKASELIEGAADEYTLLQGTMDMLIIGDEVILVDFKKSYLPVEEVKEKYRKQIELYAEAVEKGLGRKCDKKWIYVFGRDLLIEY